MRAKMSMSTKINAIDKSKSFKDIKHEDMTENRRKLSNMKKQAAKYIMR